MISICFILSKYSLCTGESSSKNSLPVILKSWIIGNKQRNVISYTPPVCTKWTFRFSFSTQSLFHFLFFTAEFSDVEGTIQLQKADISDYMNLTKLLSLADACCSWGLSSALSQFKYQNRLLHPPDTPAWAPPTLGPYIHHLLNSHRRRSAQWWRCWRFSSSLITFDTAIPFARGTRKGTNSTTA